MDKRDEHNGEEVARLINRLRELMERMDDGERMDLKFILERGYCRHCWSVAEFYCCCMRED